MTKIRTGVKKVEPVVELAFDSAYQWEDGVYGGSWGAILGFINTVGPYAGGGAAVGMVGGALVGSMCPGVGTLAGAIVGSTILGGVGLVVGISAYIAGERR